MSTFPPVSHSALVEPVSDTVHIVVTLYMILTVIRVPWHCTDIYTNVVYYFTMLQHSP